MKIAITGKGGVGKTTIAANLALAYARRDYQVYAIDADPDANLAAVLGIKEEVKPLVELEEIIEERVGGRGGLFSLNPAVDDLLEDYALKYRGIHFLQMGSLKKADSSCYCRENSFLRAVIDTLLFERQEVVILDMGAGIEHLTRGTARGVDMMLIVCEPSLVSLDTAGRIKKLALEAGIPQIAFIGNKLKTIREREFILRNCGEELLALLNYDQKLLEQGLEERGSDNPPVIEGVELLIEGIEKLSG